MTSVRAHPTDLGLCCSDVTFQLLQNASFNVILRSFCWSSSVLLLLAGMLSNQTSHRPTLAVTRPWRRRLEAFTTDSKIIRLISRRVAIFPAAAARQIFDGDCDAANREKISAVIPPNFRPCGFLDKWTEVFPVDKILHSLCHCTDCLFAVF